MGTLTTPYEDAELVYMLSEIENFLEAEDFAQYHLPSELEDSQDTISNLEEELGEAYREISILEDELAEAHDRISVLEEELAEANE